MARKRAVNIFGTMLAPALLSVFSIAACAVPIGLPEMTRDATGHSARIELGKKLFFDARLSSDGSVSCGTCHQPGHAFADDKKTPLGVHNQRGTRNAPSLLNAAYNTSFFWDGRRNTLEEQALDPLLNPAEHGMANPQKVLGVIMRDKAYISEFENVFGATKPPVTATNITVAIAAYERTLLSGNSPFDQYQYGHQHNALSPAALRGFQLFIGRAQCASCHSLGTSNALFTDNLFHSLGIGRERLDSRLPEITTRLVRSKRQGEPTDHAVITDQDIAELGRFVVTLDPADIGAFRTPSLRNVALTAPYMHDGSVSTLSEAVELEIYYRSAEHGRPLILTPVDKDDLVSFLYCLTSSDLADDKPSQAQPATGNH